MRYVLLIYGSESDSASMTQQERAALMLGHAAFAQEALARGILTGGAPMQPTSTATTVRVRDGKMLITCNSYGFFAILIMQYLHD